MMYMMLLIKFFHVFKYFLYVHKDAQNILGCMELAKWKTSNDDVCFSIPCFRVLTQTELTHDYTVCSKY